MTDRVKAACDLVVLCADLCQQKVIEVLLGKRAKSLGIRKIKFDIIKAPLGDSDVRAHWETYLQPYYRVARHCLVIFDWEGCGVEQQAAEPARLEEELEECINAKAARAGRTNWASVIAIQPELEIWAWTNSPHVPRALGFERMSYDGLRRKLRGRFPKYWSKDSDKPLRPK
ncbi:MAG TPA: hypothetical protein ENF73_01285, partial [Proteobacteria bacterium]|nr:hypothetical protein [Pseudomonadota bacterium]